MRKGYVLSEVGKMGKRVKNNGLKRIKIVKERRSLVGMKFCFQRCVLCNFWMVKKGNVVVYGVCWNLI